MRRKDELSGIKSKLLDDLSCMPVSENRIGRKIIGYFHEMSLGCGLLTRAGDARLGIANNVVAGVNHPGTN